ncbi:DUF4097 family beta strand repeat-containing protein [Shewanella colwelliana]|uniref:Lipoprotein n=1 Tax=Shewanella colwelliana TaxID=23 RepID=A0A1E5IU46_SHECO|nr:hypothetical protein [Shewanella colwelliana]MDX1281368.1 hypothetical protein [Shewanella colwelliana]OEG74006.1 hypothetical protein BEL05_20130 [Shewanella colwelliana]
MVLRPLVLSAALTFGLSGCIINVNGAGMESFDYHRTSALSLDASGLNGLEAETGSGALTIEGVEGLTQITLEANIYGYDGVEPELTLMRDGDQAKLVANFDSFYRVSFNGSSPYIDIVMKVPASMMLDIEDGSGSIDIKGIDANMIIKDGSGSIDIDGGKNVVIDDGSGSIVLANVDGNINLDDGSGSIEVSKVKGDVVINDGSGAMTVVDIAGKVTIDDGSGGIEVSNTQGLNIIEAGSGDLSFNNINGPVSMN